MAKTRTALIFTFIILLVSEASAFGQCVLRSVRVEGNSRIEAETILLQVSSSTGQMLDPDTVQRDIKAIYQTGFFDQVAAKQRRENGGCILVFSVQEKPAIREVRVEGNKEISTDTFKEKLNLGGKRFLDKRKIELGIEEVKKYYQSEGYYDTEVEYDLVPAKQNQVDLVFRVRENDKKVIRRIAFEGNKDISDSELKDQIKTSRYKWWISWLTGSGTVKQEELDQDVKTLTKYYLTKGHVDVRVGEPVIQETEDGLKIVFRINEGGVYNFGRIAAAGTLLENSAQKTLEGIESKPGELFNVEKLQKDAFTISEKYTDVGFAFANVDPVTNINRKDRTVDVTYMIDKGQLIRVNRINITGNEKTNDNVIRRSLKIGEGELFSSSKIRRSQELLQRLGYFDEVTITPEPTDDKNQVDLGVSVREGMTGSFSAGAGVSSGEGFIFSTRISENNLFGTGNSLAFDSSFGTTRENFILSFNNPRVSDSQWSLGTDLLSTKREFDEFDRDMQGGTVTVGYPLWFLGPEYLEDVRFSLAYQLLAVDITDVEEDAPQLVKDQAGASTSSSMTPRLIRNTIDNPLDPTKGSRQVLGVELAGLGGDQEFWLAEGSNSFYYPLWQSPIGLFVFSQRVHLGYGETFNGDPFPLFRRFFPGGINSVRGYEARRLGPNEDGKFYGGNKELVANFDFIWPIISSIGLSGVFFYDAGNAFDDEESIDIGELKQAIGWGIRWRSPIAPIRVEVGYPLDKEEGDKSVVLNFTFGAPL